MINLLSPEYKEQIQAARLNVSLLRINAVALITVGCASALFLFSMSWLGAKTDVAQQEYKDNEAKTAPYNSVRNQAAAFRTNLNKIKTAMDERSHYSAAMLKLAQALPAGVTLSHISLGPAFVTQPLSLNATTKDTAGALSIKQQLEATGMFYALTLGATSCDTTGCQSAITAILKPTILTTVNGGQ